MIGSAIAKYLVPTIPIPLEEVNKDTGSFHDGAITQYLHSVFPETDLTYFLGAEDKAWFQVVSNEFYYRALSTAYSVKIKAPNSLAASYTLTLPTDDGALNNLLQTNGSGVLSWSAGLTYDAATQILTLTGTIDAHHIIPVTTDTYDLGSSSKLWSKLYVDEVFSGTILPHTDNLADLGSSSKRWNQIWATEVDATTLLNVGLAGSSTGQLVMYGTTSGLITIKSKDAAGTYTLTLPDTNGDADDIVYSDGNGVLRFKPVSNAGYYVGDSSANRAIAHTVGRIPNMVIILELTTTNVFFASGLVNTGSIYKTGTAGQTVTAITSSNFYVGNSGNYPDSANLTGQGYMWIAV